MKNYMGIVWDRASSTPTTFSNVLPMYAPYDKRPVLNVVDAYR